MFSSSTSRINPFGSFSSSSHQHVPPRFSGFDTNNVFLSSQLQDPPAESLTNMAVRDHNVTMTNAEEEYYSNLNIPTSCRKPPVKKDRHSKICTAQGLRDRRVRLSIDIAREFFDLQDMLGFDKASKTLEWLLSKSREAIKELSQSKRTTFDGPEEAKSKSSSADVCEEKEMEIDIKDEFDQVVHHHHPAKDSSNKLARARARQRTREKKCIRRKVHDPETNSQNLTQFNASAPSQPNSLNPHFEACYNQIRQPSSSQAGMPDVYSSLIFTHHQNPAIENSNCIISSLPQNWDTDGAIPHSIFPAITNMNLPTTGLETCGRPWETHNTPSHP